MFTVPVRRAPTPVVLIAALALAACDGGNVALVVDLRTDYLPGHQFVGVRVELLDADLGEVRMRDDTFATSADDYLSGARVAELSSLTPGDVAIRVSLLDTSGAAIAQRTTLLTVSSQHALTVLITSSCEGVSCPGAADDPTHTACLGGRCVDPRCSPETPELCGDPGCTRDADCESPVPCAAGVCVADECFLRADDARCAASELCDPRAGCVLRPGVDAGPGCPATETSCDDGVDEDCDGATDCADSDCLGATCDDGSACTEADACTDAGTCGGTRIVCDDENLCTDDACDPASGCTFTGNSAACDDGFWCNGPDRCAGGACAPEGPAPCAQFCNESTMACDECVVDDDCGAVTRGPWGACGGFASTCDESGTQSRSVMTPRCMAGMCSVVTTSESQACPRDTEDVTCGTTTFSAWSACNYSDACDQSASRTRTRSERRCTNGACAIRSSTETGSCSRTVADGTACGGAWLRCCSGTCRDLRTNARCGACRVSCSAIGDTCASTGNGGYACRGCTTNAQCQSILNSAATCYNVAAPPAWCQCQCPSAGVCANGGCGAGFFCHACSGTNFCSPVGGSC